MDELQISGKRFISSRRIARENGYTSDYIGQLIRGGKITGQKVGRAWYVEAASFDKYLGGEGAVIDHTEAVMDLPAPVEEAKTPEQQEAVLPAPVPASAFVHVIDEEPIVAEEKQILPSVEEIKTISATEEITEEATPVAAMSSEDKQEERRIPLHLTRTEEVPGATRTTSGLRYVIDEAPSLPEIARNKKESRVSEREVSDVHALKPAFAPVASRRASRARAGLLAALALAIFAISALVSSALSLNLNIEAGNTATASYSFK